MVQRNTIKRLLSISLMGALTGLSGAALASNFQLFEYNGVNAGDAGAGGAAIAQDASTGFINPAGLTRLTHPQIVVAGTEVLAQTHFTGSSTWNSLISLPAPYSPSAYSQDGSNVSGSASVLIPALHYAAPINVNMVFGFGISVPFGLSTQYAQSAMTRYAATNSEIQTIDLSPSVGFKINDKLSLGVGFDLVRFNAILNSIGGAPGFAGGTAGNRYDSVSENEASDWGYGWHVGALYQFTRATRLGISYRSQVVLHPTGTSTLIGPAANATFPVGTTSARVTNNGLATDMILPPMTTLSLYHDINHRWAIMGSAYYTQWKTIQTITLRNVAGAQGLPINVSLPQNFNNTWRVAFGTNYKLNQKWLLRAGIGYDQSPVSDAFRSLRLPDNDRRLVSLGMHYQATKIVGLDLGWTRLFVKDVPVAYTAVSGSSATTINGTSSTSANLIGAQITWTLG